MDTLNISAELQGKLDIDRQSFGWWDRDIGDDQMEEFYQLGVTGTPLI